MNFCKRFVVELGAKVRLVKIDPAFKSKHESKDCATREIRKHPKHMTDATEAPAARSILSRSDVFCGS